MTFPLSNNSNSTVNTTGSALDRYKNLLSPDVSAENVGLFYQLNNSAAGAIETKDIQLDSRFPIEANSRNS